MQFAGIRSMTWVSFMMILPHSLCLKGWEIAQWRKQNVELIKHKADFIIKIEVMSENVWNKYEQSLPLIIRDKGRFQKYKQKK